MHTRKYSYLILLVSSLPLEYIVFQIKVVPHSDKLFFTLFFWFFKMDHHKLQQNTLNSRKTLQLSSKIHLETNWKFSMKKFVISLYSGEKFLRNDEFHNTLSWSQMFDKIILLFLVFLQCWNLLFAEEKSYVHKTDSILRWPGSFGGSFTNNL